MGPGPAARVGVYAGAAREGHYDGTFVREDGRWRFLRREAFTDIPAQPWRRRDRAGAP
ncbi:MAG TPA: hypothetical protein VFV10_08030 [Gammaproteobacteria bacterium]|nr:hypothetical protein [Gammaproteobacteria bacterium]